VDKIQQQKSLRPGTDINTLPYCFVNFFNQVITVVQILQMVVGVTVCTQSWALADKPDSYIDKNLILGGFVMYASYLVLFMQFFVDRYIVKRNKSS
jgi:hypothetical protein